jgi:hypothetical protein
VLLLKRMAGLGRFIIWLAHGCLVVRTMLGCQVWVRWFRAMRLGPCWWCQISLVAFHHRGSPWALVVATVLRFRIALLPLGW